MNTTTMNTLTDDEAWDRLRTENVGRLVTSTAGGAIDVYPVNYACLAESILIRTHPGSKLFELAVFPEVVFEVDHHDHEQRSAWSVVIHASAGIDSSTWALTAADAAGLQPVIDVDADEVVVLVPNTIKAREFSLR